MNFVIKLFLNAIAVVLAAYIIPGVHVDGFGYAVLVAALLAVLNVSLKPILVFLTIPATILTLGLFLLVVNAIIIMTADWILGNGFNVDGFWWALLFSIVLSFINSIFERLTVQAPSREDNVKIFDKEGKRIV
jgi:putative membrane protein